MTNTELLAQITELADDIIGQTHILNEYEFSDEIKEAHAKESISRLRALTSKLSPLPTYILGNPNPYAETSKSFAQHVKGDTRVRDI